MFVFRKIRPLQTYTVFGHRRKTYFCPAPVDICCILYRVEHRLFAFPFLGSLRLRSVHLRFALSNQHPVEQQCIVLTSQLISSIGIAYEREHFLLEESTYLRRQLRAGSSSDPYFLLLVSRRIIGRVSDRLSHSTKPAFRNAEASPVHAKTSGILSLRGSTG